jgi:hypothetical protein
MAGLLKRDEHGDRIALLGIGKTSTQCQSSILDMNLLEYTRFSGVPQGRFLDLMDEADMVDRPRWGKAP